jgi:hypothetical protein
MKYRLLILTAMLSGAVALNAQNAYRENYEVSYFLASGYSDYNYSLLQGEQKAGIGFGLGVEFTKNFNYQLGLTAGIEVNRYASRGVYDNFSRTYRALDDSEPAQEFDFTYSLKDFREQQSAWMLSLPLTVQFRNNVSEYSRLMTYASGGLKLGIPVISSSTSDYTVETNGYFEYENVKYENLPQHGFFTHDIVGDKHKPSLGLLLSMTFEVGLRFPVAEWIDLQGSVYLDYGINAFNTKNDRQLIEYNYNAVRYESVLNTNLADKAHPVNIGFKARIILKEGFWRK